MTIPYYMVFIASETTSVGVQHGEIIAPRPGLVSIEAPLQSYRKLSPNSKTTGPQLTFLLGSETLR